MKEGSKDRKEERNDAKGKKIKIKTIENDLQKEEKILKKNQSSMMKKKQPKTE